MPQDFFTVAEEIDYETPGRLIQSEPTFDTELVVALRRGPVEGRNDIEVAIALAALIHDDLTAYGTGGGERLTDDEMSRALAALEAVTTRLGVPFQAPFRNFKGFRGYWGREGGYGSWQARRDLLDALFEPLHRKLLRIEELSFDDLARAVSPRQATGWAEVDQELAELRRRFATCQTPTDYRDIGNRCVGLIEALGVLVYDPARHLRPGETAPTEQETKKRLDRFIDDATSDESLRPLARKTIELCQAVKHRTKPTRRDAGVAGDSVILLASMLRWLHQEPDYPPRT